MPDSLKSSLLILIAPSAVGYSSYVTTTGHEDVFTSSLFVITLFLLTVLVWNLRHLTPCEGQRLRPYGSHQGLSAGFRPLPLRGRQARSRVGLGPQRDLQLH